MEPGKQLYDIGGIMPGSEKKELVALRSKLFCESDHLLSVDLQGEGLAQHLGNLTAQPHAIQKNFKIIHQGTGGGVDSQAQQNRAAVDNHLALFYRIIHAIINIEGVWILIADTVSTYVGLIR